MVLKVDGDRRARLLRRDADLARLVERLSPSESASLVDDLVAWALARDADRRSLADEALDRYRELNMLYDLAERSASLEPEAILSAASTEVGRVCRRAVTIPFLVDEAGHELRAIDNTGFPVRAIALGEGLVGSIAASEGGEIVNDPASDPRATPAEAALGPMMVTPLRADDRRLGVLLVLRRDGPDFTAGEHRMLSAVAVLTAPALDAAMTHVQTLARAREREQELERQLEALRGEVEAGRREERVSEITGTEYFQTLRRQANVMREALKSGTRSKP